MIHALRLQRVTSLLLWAGVLCLFSSSLLAAPTFPTLTGRVVDNANLISSSDERLLTSQLEAHEQHTSNQVVVVTVEDLQGYDIADYGYQLGRHWGIGQADKNNGVILLVAPNERKVRIEVGYGLEGVLTDALAKQIIDYRIIPRFKQDKYASGIKQGVTTILGILSGSFDKSELKSSSRTGFDDQMLGHFLFMLFASLFVGALLSLSVSKKASTLTIMGGTFGIGVMLHGFIFGLIVSLAATLIHLFSILSGGGRGGGGGYGSGGYYGGGYSGGGFGGGFGGFSGGGGSFGGGGASGGW